MKVKGTGLMAKVMIVSYNVKGLNHPAKRKKVLTQLKGFKCDIAMLQETHLTEEETKKLKRDWVGQVFGSSFKKRRGAAILIKQGVHFVAEEVRSDKSGRYVMVVGTLGGEEVTLVNIYAPPEESPAIFKEVADLITLEAKGMLIWGGDMNTVMDEKVDRDPEGKERGGRTKMLNKITGELGLVEVWRFRHPREREYTFYSNAKQSQSRIDLIYIPKQHLHRVLESKIDPITISDHAPVFLE